MIVFSALLLAVAVLSIGSALTAGSSTRATAAAGADSNAPAVPIRVVGSFGPATGVAGSELASSAEGDRAVAAVLADLQDYWAGELAADGGSGLPLPTGGYVSMDSSAQTGSALCIPNPALIAGNTYYCPQGDGIVFDSSALVPVLLGSYGSAGLTAAFAHEFGHAVQAKVGPTPADRQRDPARYPSILIEAQADCDAGAFLAWAASGASQRVQLAPESLLQAVAPLLDFRDPATVTPSDPTAHGLGLDRLGFVLTGFRGGGGACPAMTADQLALTLGRVDAAAPSAAPRFASTSLAVEAAATSIEAFAGGLELSRSLNLAADSLAAAADAADLAAAVPFGQFAAGAAVALAAGRSITGTSVGAACFTGAWTASVYGKVGVGELGSWPTDADEALDLIRSRPGASFDDLAAYSDGFHQGWSACG